MGDEYAKENTISMDFKHSPDSPLEPEAKKKRVQVDDDVECVELTSDVPTEEDDIQIIDRSSPNLANCPKTPTSARKMRTPKITKEEREAERLKKLELKKQREEEREKARIERERIAEEKRLEKEKREKEREEKRKEEERKKEEKRKAEEERLEKKRKEEEEKQRRKDELAAKKREEDEKREARRREEEEKKEQRRREEQAEEEKKRRISARFMGFFNKGGKKTPTPTEVVEESTELWYKPFQVKPGMSLAPTHRRRTLSINDDVTTQRPEVTAKTYLRSDRCKKRQIVGCRYIELRAKLFQFHDNYRPPYYGTWRKRDPLVNPRKPGQPRSEHIDYEMDSDADWEDEPSDAEECKSDEDEPEDDDIDSDHCEFFVEPGYLSDGEGADDESDDPAEQGAVRDAEDPEARAARLASRASEWKKRMLDKPKLLTPRCLGPVYDLQPPACLLAFKAVALP